MKPLYLCDYTPSIESNLFRLSWIFRDCPKSRYFNSATACHFFAKFLLNNPTDFTIFDCVNNCEVDHGKTRPFRVSTDSFIKLIHSFDEKNLLESKQSYFLKVYQE